MSAHRRPVSRRRPAGAAAARGGVAGGTLNGPVADPAVDEEFPVDEELPIDEELPEEPTTLTAAQIRAERAEARRVRPEDQPQRSVLTERAGGLRKLIDDTRAELKKITWPDRETTRNLTVVVIGISVVLGIVLGGIDWVLFQIFELMT